MATDIVQGLFGMTPEGYQLEQQQRAQQQAAQFAQMNPFQQANYGLYLGANRLGGAIGGMLGAQDPMLQRISQQQALLKEVNPSDAASLAAGIKKASEMGNPQLAMSLSQALQNLQKTQAIVYKSQKEALTPEQRNAASLADSSGAERGSGEWGRAYKQNLERLTTKKPSDALLKTQAIVDARAAVRTFPEGSPERQQAEDMLRALQQDKLQVIEMGVPGQPNMRQKAFVDPYNPEETPTPIGKPYSGLTAATNINVPVSLVDKESNLRKDFGQETKPYTQVISTAGRIEKLLNMGSLGEIIAQKQFSKLAGDNNISNKDVDNLSNLGDLGQRLAGTLSRFFEGTYSEAQRQEALKLVRELKASGTSQYSQIQQQYADRARAEGIPEKTVTFIAPSLPKDVQNVQNTAPLPLPPEGTIMKNKKTGIKDKIVRNGKLVPYPE